MKEFDNKILALIMIGGESKRMGGGIKSFIKFNNKTLFDRILYRVKPQIQNIIINSNQNDERLIKYNIPMIKDLKKGYLGPLAGIHSGMHWIINNDPQIEWLVTLPGDTPFIPNNLISSFKKKSSLKSKIILAKSNDKTHPIVGAWHISLFRNLDTELDKGVRKIMSWAQMHQINYINFPSENYDPFFNINRKEDIEVAIKIEKEFL
jgi:molybdenum cofactor guanylyltransferase